MSVLEFKHFETLGPNGESYLPFSGPRDENGELERYKFPGTDSVEELIGQYAEPGVPLPEDASTEAFKLFMSGHEQIRGQVIEAKAAPYGTPRQVEILKAASYVLHRVLREYSSPQTEFNINDVIQNAFLYLAALSLKQDPSKGSLSAMAEEHLSAYIIRQRNGNDPRINDSGLTRITDNGPKSGGNGFNRIKQRLRTLEYEHGRPFDVDELTQFIAVINEEDAGKLAELEEQIKVYKKYKLEHEDPAVLESIADEDPAHDPEGVAFSKVEHDGIDQALSLLSEREIFILKSRLGLDDEGEESSLTAIGEELGLTRERIRQIEAKALAKLRKIPNILDVVNGIEGPLVAKDDNLKVRQDVLASKIITNSGDKKGLISFLRKYGITNQVLAQAIGEDAKYFGEKLYAGTFYRHETDVLLPEIDRLLAEKGAHLEDVVPDELREQVQVWRDRMEEKQKAGSV